MRSFQPLLFLTLIFIAAASPFWQSGERGIVTRVLDGDSFILNSGLNVRMAQIEAPWIRTGDDAGFAARAALSTLVLGKNVTLKYGGLRRDRAGRALAQVFVDGSLIDEGTWVNIEMLRQGHARVHTYNDNRNRIGDFWLAEREARRAGHGLWANPAYQVRFATPEALSGAERRFQLVEGNIVASEQSPRLIKLLFGTQEERDVAVMIPSSAWPLWEGGAARIIALEGHDIRVRGRVNGAQDARETKTKGRNYAAHGPQIWVDHPEQIEFIIRLR